MRWPHRIRRSRQAKRVQMRLTETDGLELVVPWRMSLQKASQFFDQSQEWLESQSTDCHNWDERQALKKNDYPTEIHLRSCEESWQVDYESQPQSRLSLTTDQHALRLSGPVADQTGCLRLLRRWVRSEARRILVPWLDRVASLMRVSYHSVAFRTQRSLWGTCSAQQEISLNDRLLFLPPALVDYVVTHELAHTIHMNHSQRFWRLVGSHCSHYQDCRRRLRDADALIPVWI